MQAHDQYNIKTLNSHKYFLPKSKLTKRQKEVKELIKTLLKNHKFPVKNKVK